ncbi:cation-transporting P-type ATPase [Exiguobacterium flavidum]|uniref:cation-transporting P-type ATPase n=1 Tax=Exiguobacterium flavidum TaxID=2184695 RepID=UPI000DF85257|nr:cation-transporting P-type ATPase [Exiguobacterium flavidum]
MAQSSSRIEQKHIPIAWHSREVEMIEQELDVRREEGLADEEATRRLEQSGLNVLPEGKKEPSWRKFLKQFNDPLIYVLIGAAVVTGGLGHVVDTVIIALVVFLMGLVGYLQESKAERALEGIKEMLSLRALVLRRGQRLKIDAAHLVRGDVVYLMPGDRIPADLRLFVSDNLKVEESALTGEAAVIEKTTEALREKIGLGDRTNLAFSGTSVAAGTGIGIVVETGSDTELGKINASIAEVEPIRTPLIEQTAQFGKMVAFAILAVSIATFLFGYYWRDFEPGLLLLAVIGLAVAVIPEGLPPIITIILAIGAREMAKRKAIVRNLPSVETLGAVSVICSDKTGTLTKNEMTVVDIETVSRRYQVTGTGYAPEGVIKAEAGEISDDDELAELLEAAVTCNEAGLYFDEGKGRWRITGDPTEGCLVTLARKAGRPVEKLPVIAKIPFDSAHKYMATLSKRDGGHVIYLKGAPDRLFAMARSSDPTFDLARWEKKLLSLARRGERVIGIAKRVIPDGKTEIDPEDLRSGVEFLGLCGIRDPLRPEAHEAVKACRGAGIQVKMITGDHKETALAIGQELGIAKDGLALEGTEMDEMDDEQLKLAAEKYNIFARTSPTNKTRLVSALQANGEIVAMTGDGVNDAPALRRADIGVAMGIKGTEVSKEAAEMVLVDDNFRTIFEAVKEGRRVYDNLKKTILFILPTNGGQGLLILASILFGVALPLTALQILWVNMVVAVTLAFANAFEPLEAGSMHRSPRPKHTPLLSRYYVFRVTLVSILIGVGTLLINAYLHRQGASSNFIHTMTLNTIVFGQLFHLFNTRVETAPAFNAAFFHNKVAFYMSFLLIVLQLLITYLPLMNKAFGTVPLSLSDWIIPIGFGLAIFLLIEVEKVIAARFRWAEWKVRERN